MKLQSNNTIFLNIFLLLAISAAGYFATLYLDRRNPNGPVQLNEVIQAPIEGIHDISPLQKAPDFALNDINGNAFSLNNFEGKIVLLNFWATWCPPCVVEFPMLIELANSRSDDVVLLAISSDMNEADIKRFLLKQNMQVNADNIHIALDKNQTITYEMYQSFALPETIIIDREGHMRLKIVGADWDIDTVQQKLSQL